MEYGERLQSAEQKTTLGNQEAFSRVNPLEEWAPERNSRLIGNKVIASSENQAKLDKTPENPTALGQIVLTPSSMPHCEVTPIETDKIYPSGHDISRETLDVLKNYEQKLAMDGDIGAFYDEIRSAREIYQSKNGGNYA